MQVNVMKLFGITTEKKINATEGSTGIVDDPLTPPVSISRSEGEKGNQYTSYDYAVTELFRKYHNLSRWGCGLVKTIIDWRATQISGNGANVSAKNKKTQKWLTDFFAYNYLDSHATFEAVRDSELEGKALLYLTLSDDKETVNVRHISYMQYKYNLQINDDDYENMKSVTFVDAAKREIKLLPDQFVFVKTSGSKRVYVNTPPRTAYVLSKIDDVDKAMSDIRENNRLFGFITPIISTNGDMQIAMAERKSLFGKLKSMWSIGKMLVTPGTFSFAEPTGNAINSIKSEVETLIRVISYVTGIPVSFLGYPDLLSNRPAAIDLNEMINITTSVERLIWEAKLKELAEKAIDMYNLANNANLSKEGIKVSLPVVSMSQIELIKDIYIELYRESAISLETLLERLPGIDPVFELQRINQAKEQRNKNIEEYLMTDTEDKDTEEVTDEL